MSTLVDKVSMAQELFPAATTVAEMHTAKKDGMVQEVVEEPLISVYWIILSSIGFLLQVQAVVLIMQITTELLMMVQEVPADFQDRDIG